MLKRTQQFCFLIRMYMFMFYMQTLQVKLLLSSYITLLVYRSVNVNRKNSKPSKHSCKLMPYMMCMTGNQGNYYITNKGPITLGRLER